MPIHFRCPHCDKLLALGQDKAGTQILCPLCEKPLTVPPRTEIKLPTTTVLSAEAAQSWWLDAPPVHEPAQSAPPVESPPAAPPTAEPEPWWLTSATATPATPLPNVPPPTPPLEAIVPSAAAPEPLTDLVVREPDKKPVVPKPRRRPSTGAPSLPRTHLLILAGVAVVLIGVNLALLWNAMRKTAEDDPNKPPSSAKREKSSEPGKQDNKSGQTGRDNIPVKSSTEESSHPTRLFAVKRRRATTEEDLRREAAAFPELSLEREDIQHARRLVLEAEDQGEMIDVPLRLVEDRPALAGLPLRRGEAARLNADAVRQLQTGSLALRSRLFQATRGRDEEARPDVQKLRAALAAADAARNKWLKPEAIPALQQLLMGEDADLRTVLVDELARIEGPQASNALAQRTLFDLSPNVRQSALAALAKRPRKEYQGVLLDGFRYPWPAVADHAAEALAALDVREAGPILRSLLDQPDPAAPFKKTGKLEPFVREVVRINHLRNCVLCHAPSLSDEDKLRGFVPSPDQPVPPPFSREYYANRRSGFFVRADRTYLRQDFALRLAVKNPGPWPAVQRYDCVVRERPATPVEVQRPRPSKEQSEYQQAIRFALRELERDNQ